jgi:2-oxoglutarate dehydrogenase E1 component
LGFDYGYSVVWPESLVLWEAQFGDFVNAAQVIIDQFIAAGEEKWHQKCNLVMLLPHGYEGQGPEHSSGRVERFLQLCAGGNMFVVCATTASQYFHLLRRQIKKPINKPLIVMTPKSLLRMHEASSPISEFTTGEFRPVLPDTDITDNSRVKKALLCTGKVYYDLEIERRRIKDDTTAIIRVEQLYPFPKTLLAEQISLYNSNVEIRWVQEEPQNMGYWHYIEPRLRDLFKKEIKYIGRYPSSSTATGSHTIHHTEQKHLTEEAFK